MMTGDNELTRGLRALADRRPTGQPPVAALLRRGARQQRNRLVASFVAAGVAVVAVGAATVIGIVGPGHLWRGSDAASTRQRHGTPGASSPAAGPRVPLAAAVARTAGTTFRITDYDNYRTRTQREVCSGAWDPRRQVSWMATPPQTAPTAAVIGDNVYTREPGDARGWHQLFFYAEPDPETLGAFRCGGSSVAQARVLDDMKQVGPITYTGRKTSGGKDFDVYSVTSTKPVRGGYATTQAWVGVRSGYLEQVWSWRAPRGQQAPEGRSSAATVAIYSHFGEPVTNPVPPRLR